jgi:hypothetical protein
MPFNGFCSYKFEKEFLKGVIPVFSKGIPKSLAGIDRILLSITMLYFEVKW